MEFNKKPDGTYEQLKQKNVDTGMGMERNTALLAWLKKIISYPDPFLTDLFASCRHYIQEISGKDYEDPFRGSIRIVLDHLRAVTFLLADGAEPSNKERGYVTRRLIRRAIRHGEVLGIHVDFLSKSAELIIKTYQQYYPELKTGAENIKSILFEEEVKFRKLLERGTKIIDKQKKLDGKLAFDLYQSYGIPAELTFEIARDRGVNIDKKMYEAEFKKHQDLSRTATKGVFKGGLQDHSEKTTKLHTATHMLQQALREVLGKHVRQKGSHITAERLRFDFTHPKKMTSAEIATTEKLVNEKISKNLKVSKETVNIDQAIKTGALTIPGAKYPEKVTVYRVGDFSTEVCGGPHVDFTASMGKIKIIKEEALGTLNRRIYAILS